MKLNRQTDFAFRVLMLLATEDKTRLLTITELSERLHVSRNHLVKIISRLNRLGYIETIRGAKGGLRLKMHPQDINIGQVVREFEPSLELINCKMPECPLRGECQLKQIIDVATLSFIDKLSTYTLKDVT